MPYNNPYNRSIASAMHGLNERFAHLYAYSPVDGGNPYSLDGGNNAGVLYQVGNASKRDAEDNIVNDNMNLPPVYYMGNDIDIGGNGFAKGTYRDRGDGVQDGASGDYMKGSGDFKKPILQPIQSNPFGSGMDQLKQMMSSKGAKEIGEKMEEFAKEQHMKGGSFWTDFKEGFNSVFEPAAKYILKPLATVLGQPEVSLGLEALGYGKKSKKCPCGNKKCKCIGGAILGNPDPYPVQGNSERIAGRGKKGVEPSALLDLANGTPPKEQLRGSYGGAKPSKEEIKVMKAVAKKLKGTPEIVKMKGNARAEIVKKVMKEKGMKMIEASKYVKEHNLYKK